MRLTEAATYSQTQHLPGCPKVLMRCRRGQGASDGEEGALVGSQDRSLPGDDIWSSVGTSPTTLEGRASEAEGQRGGRLLGVKGGLREVAKAKALLLAPMRSSTEGLKRWG